MISFLNSVVLPALLALAIPILIHFFNRRKTKKILFSSLRFLKLLENQKIKQIRLYQILLILLRTLLILFLVLAFSRPTLKSSFITPSASARTTVVIILDDSYSMQSFAGSISKFNLALEQLKKILNTLKSEDQVFILPTSTYKNHLKPLDLAASSYEKIKPFSVTYGSPDFDPVFKTAEQIFQDYPNYNRELYLLSDQRINHFALRDSIYTIFTRKEIITYLINLPNEQEFRNIGIDTVIIENQLFELNKQIRFKIRLQNYNLENAAESGLSLFREETRIGMEQIRLEPGELKEISLSYIPNLTGTQLLQFELDDDDLLADNHYYLNFHIAEDVKILYVDDQPSLHLITAMNVLSERTVLNIEPVSFAQWFGKKFEKYDLIILNNPPQLNPEAFERLSLYLKNQNLLIIPGLNLTPSQCNSMFSSLVSTDLFVDYINFPSRDYYLTLNENTFNLPLFEAVFRENENDSEPPKVYKYFLINKKVPALLTLQNGDPFLSSFQSKGEGLIFVFASAFDMDWNDFPARGFFIPLLYRIFFTSAQAKQTQRNIIVNEDYLVTLSPHSINDQYFLERSAAESYQVIPEQSSQGIQFLFASIDRPGHSLIKKNDQIIHSFSVNLSSKELKRPYLDFSALTKEVVHIRADEDMTELIQNARRGQELWFIFLLLALSMLLMEMLLIKKIEGQGKLKSP